MAKRGRPRKQGVKRTKSGQISRAKAAYQENKEPIRIRARKLNLTEEAARDQKAQSVHGLMCLRQQITQEQYEAGEEMFHLRQDYLKAIKAPNALAKGQGAGMSIEATPEYQEWAKRIIARHDVAKASVAEAQLAHRGHNLLAALDYMIYRNEHHRHMEADTKIVLRTLSLHFGLTKNQQSDSVHEIPRSQRCA